MPAVLFSPDSETIKIRSKERLHGAQGCERGVRASLVGLHAPVTSQPAPA